jgi:alanine dehydrogenase
VPVSRLLVLGRADLERLLTPRDVIDALRDAFAGYARGLASVPARSGSPVSDDGLLLVMPAALRSIDDTPGIAGVKVLTVHRENRARGVPTIHAMYALLDATTGTPLALLEGTFVTAVRTGATSALAARFLARPDSRSVACFGAGVQAGFQLRCLASVLPLAEVEVVGRDPERAHAFAEAMARELTLPVSVAPDPRASVRRADVVTCATTSAKPVVFGADLREGTHVDAVGAYRSDMRELDTDAMQRARVVVDTYAGALEEAGDVLMPIAEGAFERTHVAAELAELVTGARPGRQHRNEVTVFKSVGFALEDLVTAHLAYRRASELNIGARVEL